MFSCACSSLILRPDKRLEKERHQLNQTTGSVLALGVTVRAHANKRHFGAHPSWCCSLFNFHPGSTYNLITKIQMTTVRSSVLEPPQELSERGRNRDRRRCVPGSLAAFRQPLVKSKPSCQLSAQARAPALRSPASCYSVPRRQSATLLLPPFHVSVSSVTVISAFKQAAVNRKLRVLLSAS